MWEFYLSLTIGKRELPRSMWLKRVEDLGMADDLDDFLKDVAERVDEDFRTREAAAQNAERERQEFLQGFRDIADRIIKPEFERAQRKTESFTIKADSSRDSIELRVTMKKNNVESTSGFLRYKADLNTRRVMREGHVDRLPQRRDNFPIHTPSFNAQSVIDEIRSLVNDVKFSLERHS